MTPEFWQARWQNKQIGFNQAAVNPWLVEYFNALDLSAHSRILVPLCGKSIDMVWLATQGHDVVGIELSEIAVQAFFAEHDITPRIIKYQATKKTTEQAVKAIQHSVLKCYQGKLLGQTITLWVANIFALTAKDIGHIDAVYDRAALIALPADMRASYVEQIRVLSNNAPTLLLTFNYDQSLRDNKPPFSVSHAQIKQYYGQHYQITETACAAATLRSAAQLQVTEHVWLLSR